MEHVDVFISLVQQKRIIYDLKSPHYKNVYLRKQAWEDISKAINYPVEKCMQKWKALRYKYMGERRKLKLPSGSGAPSSKCLKRWHYYNYMNFLDNYIGDSSTETSLQFVTLVRDQAHRVSISDSLTDSLSSDVFIEDLSQNDGTIESNSDDIIVDLDSLTPSPVTESLITSTPVNFEEIVGDFSTPSTAAISADRTEAPSGTKVTSRKKSAASKIEDLLRLELTGQPTGKYDTPAPRQDLNGTEHFFMCMAKEVMKLPEQTQDKIKLDIHELLYRAKYNVL